MDDELNTLEPGNSGHHGKHIRDEFERLDSEPEDPHPSGLDPVKRNVKPREAHDLALRENITIAEAYSRLSGADEE